VKGSFYSPLPKPTNCTTGPWSAAIPGTEPIKKSFISNKKDSAQITGNHGIDTALDVYKLIWN